MAKKEKRNARKQYFAHKQNANEYEQQRKEQKFVRNMHCSPADKTKLYEQLDAQDRVIDQMEQGPKR